MTSRRYPIPSKPENLKEVFLSFCENLQPEQVSRLISRLRDRQQQLQHPKEETFLAPNSELGARIASVCIQLLESYDDLAVSLVN